jgi:regulator of sigma E protease
MNALFAVAIYAFLAGRYGVARDTTTTVGEVRAGVLPMGAAPLATLQPGERIVRISGDTVRGWRDVVDALLTTTETPIRIDVAGRTAPVLVDVPLKEQESRGRLVQALVPWHDPLVGEVAEHSPASAAGFRPGDRVLRVNGDTVPAWEPFVRVVEGAAGETLTVDVLRGAEVVPLRVAPRPTTVNLPGGRTRTVGRIGIAVHREVERFGLGGALRHGAGAAAADAGLVLFTLKGLILGQLSVRDLGGPILIGQLAGEAARQGTATFLRLFALISMNLAVLNLLPIPVLDGGHLVFLIAEGIRRRPVPVALRQRLTHAGMLLLVALMILAFANDLMRVFGGLLG